MMRKGNPNLEILARAVELLGSLADEMVFLGGCATGLLITDPASPPVRVTRDVDVVTEISSRTDYYKLSEKLRERGFCEDSSEGAPLCRWVSGDILLDVMPTSPEILGFSNSWYCPAIDWAVMADIPTGYRIRIVTGPYFLGTKLEAFFGRGEEDYMSSHDMEDIIALIDGRPEIVAEVKDADREINSYLSEKFSALLKESGFIECLPGHLPPDAASQERLPLIIDRIREMAGQHN